METIVLKGSNISISNLKKMNSGVMDIIIFLVYPNGNSNRIEGNKANVIEVLADSSEDTVIYQ